MVQEADNLGRIPEKSVESARPLTRISLAVDYYLFNISKHSRREINLIAYKERHFVTVLCAKHLGFC